MPSDEATVRPTESEIATFAYQLWLDKGSILGWDQEDWFRAETLLKMALVACEDPSRHPSIPPCDTRAEFEMLAEFQGEGHWEVWESEWGAARWVWGLPLQMLKSRAAAAGGSA